MVSFGEATTTRGLGLGSDNVNHHLTMLPQMIAILILGNKTGKGKGNVIRNSPPGGFKIRRGKVP